MSISVLTDKEFKRKEESKVIILNIYVSNMSIFLLNFK